MIQANELRIGNWVTELIKNRIVSIDGIESNQDFVWVNYLNGSGQYKVGINDIDPIPLTPEILEKCGFVFTPNGDEVYNQIWKLGQFEIWEHDSGFCHDFHHGGDIKSLHQLQNLYYALTGEELIYKP